MTDYTELNPDGSVNWAKSHQNRINGATPQPTVNQPVVRQPEPNVRTLGEQIAWNSGINNALAGIWSGKIEVPKGMDYLEVAELEAERIEKLILINK